MAMKKNLKSIKLKCENKNLDGLARNLKYYMMGNIFLKQIMLKIILKDKIEILLGV
jgi:hypothetical protein